MHEQRIKEDFNKWVGDKWPLRNQYMNSLHEAYGTGFYAGLRFACECEDRAANINEGANLQATNSRYVTALAVFEDFLLSTDGGIKGPFQQWCRERLNAEEPHCT